MGATAKCAVGGVTIGAGAVMGTIGIAGQAGSLTFTFASGDTLSIVTVPAYIVSAAVSAAGALMITAGWENFKQCATVRDAIGAKLNLPVLRTYTAQDYIDAAAQAGTVTKSEQAAELAASKNCTPQQWKDIKYSLHGNNSTAGDCPKPASCSAEEGMRKTTRVNVMKSAKWHNRDHQTGLHVKGT